MTWLTWTHWELTTSLSFFPVFSHLYMTCVSVSTKAKCLFDDATYSQRHLVLTKTCKSKRTNSHTSNTLNKKCKDTWGARRCGQESDQKPEPEIIKTDPSAACENESIIFPQQWKPYCALSQRFVIKGHIKISNVTGNWKENCENWLIHCSKIWTNLHLKKVIFGYIF